MIAVIIALTPMLAMADESISGQWEANLGHNVIVATDAQRHNRRARFYPGKIANC
jgi:hypothetical protein